MLRLRSLAICAAGLIGACNSRRATDPSATDTAPGSLPTTDPLAALGAALTGASTAEGGGPVDPAVAGSRMLADDDTEIDPTGAKTFLVWTRDEHGLAVTHHLDRAGEELERMAGVHVGTRAGTWQWSEEEVSLPTKACERRDEKGDLIRSEPPAPGRATRVKLIPTAGSIHEQRVVDPSAPVATSAEPSAELGGDSPPAAGAAEETATNEEDGDLFQDAEDLHHTVSLSGSIGPYLFFEESTYAYTCGAHGNTSVSARIWNVASAQPEPMPADIGPLEGPGARAAEELTDEDDPFPVTNDNLEVTALFPRYAPKGVLRLGVQFTAPTCYACTRGGFSSYTKSTVVEAATVPKAFARYATAPDAVRTWAASHPDERVGGWSGLAW